MCAVMFALSIKRSVHAPVLALVARVRSYAFALFAQHQQQQEHEQSVFFCVYRSVVCATALLLLSIPKRIFAICAVQKTDTAAAAEAYFHLFVSTVGGYYVNIMHARYAYGIHTHTHARTHLQRQRKECVVLLP